MGQDGEMTNWYCTFHYPRDWVEVVHQPAGGRGAPALADQVREALERSPADPALPPPEQRVATVLPLVEQDAERAAALSAHGFRDSTDGSPVEMHLTMWVEPRSHPDSVVDELDLLGTTVREAGVNLAPPEVTNVSLPAGPALRVRQLENVGRPDGRTEMVDCVDYWIPVDRS